MPVGPITQLEILRRGRLWSQGQLAQNANVDRTSVSRSEAGLLPSERVRKQLAEALGTSVEAIWPTEANGLAAHQAEREEATGDGRRVPSH